MSTRASAAVANGRRAWWRWWTAASVLAAVVATGVDAALLQRARSYFTGGFLAADSITSPLQAAAFVAGSLLADIGALGVAVAVGLWVCGALGLAPWLAVCATAAAALVPVAVSNFTQYELASYLGDAFDFSLMFDLAGRNVSEILAVSSAHLTTIAAVGAAALGLALAGVLLVRRRLRTSVPWPGLPPLRRALVWPLALCVLATVVTTALRSSSDVLDNGLRRKPTGQALGMAVNALSDVDRDGYGLLGRPPDANLFDARVRPYAVDVPGDGVDQDAVAGDLPADAPTYTEPSGVAPQWPSKPDVVLVVLESFRADAVGALVGGQPVTPVLDALARHGISAHSAYSHNGYTVQARHHIFTGSLADIRGGTTLIDDFNANGYETAYFSGQDESFGGPANGVGFERAAVSYDARSDKDLRYSSFSTAGSLAVPYTVLLKRVTDFLAARDHTKPLFLYVNFHDTHFPYHHAAIEPILSATFVKQGDIAPSNAAAVRTTYLNTAANVDRAIGRVLEAVRRTQGREPGVVVLSDHGESLFDEGFLGHGYALNEAQTRIPFIVSNLPAVVTEPLGQGELRDILWQALAAPAADGHGPILREDRSRRVFQYLGTLDRPAQIAFTGIDTQIAFDFRAGTVRLNRGAWQSPDTLSAADRERWRDLVTTWERMILSRNEQRTRPGTS